MRSLFRNSVFKSLLAVTIVYTGLIRFSQAEENNPATVVNNAVRHFVVSNTYRYKEVSGKTIDYKLNHQSVGFAKGKIYLGFDVGNGDGILMRYSVDGKLELVSKKMPIGHCADMEFRQADGKLYVVLGGGKEAGKPWTMTKVARVDPDTLEFEELIDCSDLGYLGGGRGYEGMVGIDNETDTLIIYSKPDHKGQDPAELPKVSFLDWKGIPKAERPGFHVRPYSDWHVDPSLTEEHKTLLLMIPQGMQVVGKELWIFWTRVRKNVHGKGHWYDNVITTYDLGAQDGPDGYVPPTKTYRPTDDTTEGEGIAFDESTGDLWLGFRLDVGWKEGGDIIKRIPRSELKD